MFKLNQDELGILGTAAPITALKIANVPFCVCDMAGFESAVEEMLGILGGSFPDVYIVPTETIEWDTQYYDCYSDSMRNVGRTPSDGCGVGSAIRFHWDDSTYTFDTSVVGACELGKMITDTVKSFEAELE